MKISEYTSTVEKIKPDDSLRDRICSIQNEASIKPVYSGFQD